MGGAGVMDSMKGMMGGNFNALLESTFDALIVVSSADL